MRFNKILLIKTQTIKTQGQRIPFWAIFRPKIFLFFINKYEG